MKKAIGAAFVLLPFVFVIAFTAITAGPLLALASVATAAALVGSIGWGCYLLKTEK